jgi:hypothetical protein
MQWSEAKDRAHTKQVRRRLYSSPVKLRSSFIPDTLWQEMEGESEIEVLWMPDGQTY